MIRDIISLGFGNGNFAASLLIPTLGFGIGEVPPQPPDQQIQIEFPLESRLVEFAGESRDIEFSLESRLVEL